MIGGLWLNGHGVKTISTLTEKEIPGVLVLDKKIVRMEFKKKSYYHEQILEQREES